MFKLQGLTFKYFETTMFWKIILLIFQAAIVDQTKAIHTLSRRLKRVNNFKYLLKTVYWNSFYVLIDLTL